MSLQNGYANGGTAPTMAVPGPRVIEVPLKEEAGATLEIDCETLEEDTSELCEILNSEEVSLKFWIKFAFEYNRHGMVDNAIDMLQKSIHSTARPTSDELLPVFLFLAALYMHKSRDAPKASTGGASNAATKESLQLKAVAVINEAVRINPNSSLTLLITAIQRLSTASNDRKTAEQILRLFEELLKRNPNNVIALIGKARLHYGRSQYAIALRLYQKALTARPDMQPDPRIGIGQCFWHLKMKTDARAAWERALELQPGITSANVLLAIWYLDAAFQGVDIKTFTDLYGKAMQYAQKSYKLSQHLPSAALILAQYFYSKKNYQNVIRLAEKVLDYTDVKSIQSEAYYWIGRTHHALHAHDNALQFYQKARATNEANLAATIGIGQLQVLQRDVISAKLTFERLLEGSPKCIEALTILGFIYANEAREGGNKVDKNAERTKARGFFDKALKLIEETKGRTLDDPRLCVTQSQLWEADDVDMSLKLLEQARELQGEAAPPQLINNIAVLQHTKGNLSSAQLLYQSAWEEMMKDSEEGSSEMSDMLITLSYNLGRLEEDAGNVDEAKKTYEGLLKKHPDYVDAVARLCYLEALETSFDPSSKLLQTLLQIDPSNLDSRALLTWHLSHQRRSRQTEDQEQKHLVSTLRQLDNHDTYSLISLANGLLRRAREMHPATESEKEKRRELYARAAEMFQKALELEPRNAYAAQGVGIAFAEERQYVQANMIFNKVRETVKDVSVFINMGHCYADQRDWIRAIQNYETALEKKSSVDEFNLLCCLGRVWLLRGREEKNPEFIKTSIEYTRKALVMFPDNANVKFNIAFDQFQLAEVLRDIDPSKKTVKDIEEASSFLEEAIDSLSDLAELKTPPWPKDDLVQRATMGRNTLRRQLERTLASQREYEQANSEKMEEFRARREEAARIKAEAAERAAAEASARQEKLLEERKKMIEEIAEQAAARKEEAENAQQKKPRGGGRRSKKATKDDIDDEEEEGGGAAAESDDSAPRPEKRKRKVLARGAREGNVLSAERIVDSDDDDDETPEAEESTAGDADEGDKRRNKKRKVVSQSRVIDSDDEDEVMMENDAGPVGAERRGVVHDEGSDDDLFGGADEDKMAED